MDTTPTGRALFMRAYDFFGPSAPQASTSTRTHSSVNRQESFVHVTREPMQHSCAPCPSDVVGSSTSGTDQARCSSASAHHHTQHNGTNHNRRSSTLPEYIRHRPQEPGSSRTRPQDKDTPIGEHVRTAWNKLKYGWGIKRTAHFNHLYPIWLLGRLYHGFKLDQVADDGFEICFSEEDQDFKDFYTDYVSRIWLTYRTGFERIGDTSVTTDCGWGCMLRSGQMMIAQALLVHTLGRSWTLRQCTSTISERAHRSVLCLFGDQAACALSIHRLTELGAAGHDKMVGDWYGPASVAALIRDVWSTGACQSHAVLQHLAVHVARDCTIFLKDIDALCEYAASPSQSPVPSAPLPQPQSQTNPLSPPASAEWHRSLILLVPLRLGCERVNVQYAEHVKTLLSLEACVGIIGGKPKHGMYFVGWHHRSMLYLDPHCAQPAIDVVHDPLFDTKSFHCRWPQKIHFDEIDPSSCVGFYCRQRHDLFDLLDHLKGIIDYSESDQSASSTGRNALFSVVDAHSHVTTQHSVQSANHHSPVISHGFELL